MTPHANAPADWSAMLSWIAGALGARDARDAGRIQPLWAGYGELFRIELSDGPVRRAIVKWARPPRDANNTSATRKRGSFDVETTFYRRVAPRCDDTCRVPVLLALYGRSDEPADGIDHARLDTYFRHLRRAIGRRPDAGAVDITAIETEWRGLYPVARLDFCRFLAGWRPEMWRRDRRGQRFVRAMLDGGRLGALTRSDDNARVRTRS